jgi:hypothetical protein
MCWMVVAALAIAAVTTAVTASAQASAADAQNKATSAWSMAQSKAIVDNAISQYGQGQQQIIYHDAQARQKQQQEDLSANAAMAQAATNASGRGVTGNSVAAIQNDYQNRRDSFNADVEYNRTAADNEIMTQLQGVQNQSQGQLNDVSSHYLQPGPSPLAIGAQFVGTAASSYGAMGGFNTPSPAVSPYSGLEIPTANMSFYNAGF